MPHVRERQPVPEEPSSPGSDTGETTPVQDTATDPVASGPSGGLGDPSRDAEGNPADDEPPPA